MNDACVCPCPWSLLKCLRFIYAQMLSCCGSNAGFRSKVPVLPVHGNPLLRSLEQKTIKTVRCWLWLILLSCFWSNTILSPQPGVFFKKQRSLLEVEIFCTKLEICLLVKIYILAILPLPWNLILRVGMVSAKEHNLSQYSAESV